MFPHRHTWCSKISTFGTRFPKHMGGAYVFSRKHKNEKGTRLGFQLSPPSLLQAGMCYTSLFLVSPRQKSKLFFSLGTFSPETFTFEIKSYGNNIQRETRNLTASHDKLRNELPKTYASCAVKLNLTYKTFN